VSRTRLQPLLSAATEAALPRDHDPGCEEVGFVDRADEYNNNNNNNNNNNTNNN
jgi:hypothetical protein